MDPQAARVVALGRQEGLSRANEDVRWVVGVLSLGGRLDGVGALKWAALVFKI